MALNPLPFPQLHQILRGLRRSPGYALAAVLTLAVGLAGAVAALAPAWDLLGVPFGLQAPGRIVCVSGEGSAGAPFFRPLSAPDFWDLHKDLRSFQGVAACRDGVVDLETPEGTRELRTGLVSPGFFQVMGMPLALGRDFSELEALEGGNRALVLTYGFWQSQFGGDPQVLGRSLVLEGVPRRIVGVLAPQPRLPFWMDEAVAFEPLVFRGAEVGRDGPSCWVFGRLARGATLGGLQTELDRLAPSLGPARPAGDPAWGLKARGLVAFWRAWRAPSLALTTLSGFLILLLACANAAHLMLARNLDRTLEWGLRAALGAGPLGLGRPILVEAVLLCGCGMALAWPLLAGLQALEVLPEPILVPMAAALAVSVLVTSLLPMRWASRLDLNEALREGGTASASQGSNLLRGGLAVLQLALAFALLVGAGLSLRAVERLQHLDPGYTLKNLKVAVVKFRPDGDVLARSRAFQSDVLAALADHSAIASVAMANTRPLVDQGHFGTVWPEGGQGLLEAGHHRVSPGYFKTLGLPLLAGRYLTQDDPGACLVSLAFARRTWGEASALGRRLHLESAESPAWTVVGVVGEARMGRFTREALPAVYTPLALQGAGSFTIYLRSAAPDGALRDLVKQVVLKADGAAHLREFESLEDRVSRELAGPQRLRWQTLGAGLLASLLAGVGLAGTLSQAAARQKREWGIRLALGASPMRLFGMVFRRVAALLGAGLALGGVLAWTMGRMLQHQFQGVDSVDPGLLVLALLSLGLTGCIAGLAPAFRAGRIQPADALRSE